MRDFIEGADLVLMLSTMLHSIGVGNMTPAGVKMVCVDINPAVVTKLSDRGSLESIGVVTDVGLFLSLLVNQLNKLTGRICSASVGRTFPGRRPFVAQSPFTQAKSRCMSLHKKVLHNGFSSPSNANPPRFILM
jgi:hypothetical protein